ncbi:photosystem reaction center subunit H [Bacillus sp. HNG]|uniref:PRC-barrel domain-containing protein n=1 Tax=Bacillaceae TaxID=186817 RepID=UPI000E2F8417|nr:MULTISPECIES: PRC-barrel domain-containing protein [Bacillaceae]MDR4889054.1 PRC-barrel domain-containing protein [Fredinandcohnia sp. QZ13]RFB17631.1 photosystem reaction center subunit H [Bacillus sp. HNG]
MRTFSLLKNLPIYDENSAEVIGRVADLCITSDGKVNALIMKGKGLFERDRVVPIQSISAIGDDGIMVSDVQMLEHLDHEADTPTYFLHTHHGLFRKPLLSAEGQKLGLLEDVYFSEEVGTIIGYEVTDGFFADITEGKKVVKTEKPLKIGEDVIVVDV